MGWRVTFPGRAADLFTLGHAGRSDHSGSQRSSFHWMKRPDGRLAVFHSRLCVNEARFFSLAEERRRETGGGTDELDTWPKAQKTKRKRKKTKEEKEACRKK